MLLGQGSWNFTGQVGGGAELSWSWSFTKEPPSDFSPVTVTVPGMAESERVPPPEG